MEQSRTTGSSSSSSSNVFDLKRCFVSLVDIRSNANILNMFPTSLNEETSKNKKDTCVKLRHMHAPTKGFLKNKEEENKENLDFDYKEESNEDSETSSDDDDPSYGKRKNQSKKRIISKKSKRIVLKKESAVLSTYEKMIEDKKAEKLAFLKSLKIDEVKADFSESVNAIKEKAKHDKKPFIKKVYSKTRSSKRLASMNARKNVLEGSLEKAEVKTENMHSIPSKITFREALYSLYTQDYESYVEYINIQMPKSTGKHLSYDRSVLQNLTLEYDNIIKVVPERISAMTWYPSADHLILAAGSKMGNIGICNLDSESCPYVFKIHNGETTCLQFNPFNPVLLFSSSYEGVLYHGDMIKQEFTKIYDVSKEARYIHCTCFDFFSPTTYLVALDNGDVAILDERMDIQAMEKRHTCHSKSITSVSIHPVNKNFFVTAENEGSVCLWDLRRLRPNLVANINNHRRCLNSAFFSPLSGNSILTTSLDDDICIYDSTKLTENMRLTNKMRQDFISTGHVLATASWLPHSDDLFVVSKHHYFTTKFRTIQVFDKDMKICHLFNFNGKGGNYYYNYNDKKEYTNVFHPFKPAFAGGGTSGKAYVFL